MTSLYKSAPDQNDRERRPPPEGMQAQRFAAPPNGNQLPPPGQVGPGNMPSPYMNMAPPGQPGQVGRSMPPLPPQARPAAFPGNRTQPFINSAASHGNGAPGQPQQPGQAGQPMPAPRPAQPARGIAQTPGMG